jgi:histone H3/H4
MISLWLPLPGANKENTDMSEILVVASKVKSFIKEKSGMNTSGSVPEELSKRVAILLEKAVENAKNDGRKTVMDRDIPQNL